MGWGGFLQGLSKGYNESRRIQLEQMQLERALAYQNATLDASRRRNELLKAQAQGQLFDDEIQNALDMAEDFRKRIKEKKVAGADFSHEMRSLDALSRNVKSMRAAKYDLFETVSEPPERGLPLTADVPTATVPTRRQGGPTLVSPMARPSELGRDVDLDIQGPPSSPDTRQEPLPALPPNPADSTSYQIMMGRDIGVSEPFVSPREMGEERLAELQAFGEVSDEIWARATEDRVIDKIQQAALDAGLQISIMAEDIPTVTTRRTEGERGTYGSATAQPSGKKRVVVLDTSNQDLMDQLKEYEERRAEGDLDDDERPPSLPSVSQIRPEDYEKWVRFLHQVGRMGGVDREQFAAITDAAFLPLFKTGMRQSGLVDADNVIRLNPLEDDFPAKHRIAQMNTLFTALINGVDIDVALQYMDQPLLGEVPDGWRTTGVTEAIVPEGEQIQHLLGTLSSLSSQAYISGYALDPTKTVRTRPKLREQEINAKIEDLTTKLDVVGTDLKKYRQQIEEFHERAGRELLFSPAYRRLLDRLGITYGDIPPRVIMEPGGILGDVLSIFPRQRSERRPLR